MSGFSFCMQVFLSLFGMKVTFGTVMGEGY